MTSDAGGSSSGLRQSRYNVVVERDHRVWVYNSLSGKLMGLAEDDWASARAFLAGADTYPPVALLHDLTRGRMIVEEELEELDVLERRYRAGTADRSSFGLTIVTSLGCNFDCPYCYQVKPRAILDDATVELLLEVLDEQLPAITRFHVTWFGGEPLLATERLFELSGEFLRRTAEAGVGYTADIVTNGYLLTPETAERLRDHQVIRAQVTLDGPPETHDLMRPLRNGRGTFDVILDNIVSCADILPISIRVNLDASNVGTSRQLLDLLAERGLGGRVSVNPARIVAYDEGIGAPSETYAPQCFTLPEFAEVRRDFLAYARALGLASASLPQPVQTPCTAVRVNELVVGAGGELYKCWDSVGNDREVIGHLSSWRDPNDRVLKWLRYDPFQDAGCRSCIALPTCMGGCAHHQMTGPGDSKCSTFRITHRAEIEAYVDAAESAPDGAAQATAMVGGPRRSLLPILDVS